MRYPRKSRYSQRKVQKGAKDDNSIFRTQSPLTQLIVVKILGKNRRCIAKEHSPLLGKLDL